MADLSRAQADGGTSAESLYLHRIELYDRRGPKLGAPLRLPEPHRACGFVEALPVGIHFVAPRIRDELASRPRAGGGIA